jgi:hypothetical protein
MSIRNSSNVKVALDSKAARFNVKRRELQQNRFKSKQYERTVSLALTSNRQLYFFSALT